MSILVIICVFPLKFIYGCQNQFRRNLINFRQQWFMIRPITATHKCKEQFMSKTYFWNFQSLLSMICYVLVNIYQLQYWKPKPWCVPNGKSKVLVTVVYFLFKEIINKKKNCSQYRNNKCNVPHRDTVFISFEGKS